MKKVKSWLILLTLFMCLTGCGKKINVVEVANSYIDAIEKQYMLSQIDSQAVKMEPGKYLVKDLIELGVETNNVEPKTNGVVIINSKGAVDEAWLQFGDYRIYYDGSYVDKLSNSEEYPDGKTANWDVSYIKIDELKTSSSTKNKKSSSSKKATEEEKKSDDDNSSVSETSGNNGNVTQNNNSNNNSQSNNSNVSNSQQTQNSEPSVSVSKQNALKKARSYLSHSAFSRDGLIHQLEYEQYPTEDAIYAVDNVGADWNAQALKKANSYLSHSAFSRSGLIGQLEYEGFTSDQAEYAVNNCGADWNAQAAKKAQSYLSHSAFSRDGLIGQLEYEGFTHEQAEYGVNSVGL